MRATDAGGPYRNVLEQAGIELQSNILPLFIKTPNSVYMESANQDLFVPRPSSTSAQHLQMYEFIGKLMGLAIRTKNLWNLSLPSIVWKALVQEEITDADVRGVDELAYAQMEKMTAIAQAMQRVQDSSSSSFASSTPATSTIDPSTLTQLLSSSIKFTLIDSENRTQPLCPNGHSVTVTAENFAEYVRLTREFRSKEFDVQCRAIKRGLSTVIPPSVLTLLTWRELESQVCGRGLGVEDIELLEKMTKYSGCSRNDRHIENFWRMMRERFTDEQRAQFLVFTYGRSRLPSSSADVDSSFTIMRAAARPLNPTAPPPTAASLAAAVDRQLVTSHTCGFALELPAYSSLDIMTERVLYAIAHVTEIDADGGAVRTGSVRMHDQEGEDSDQEGIDDYVDE